MRGPDPVPSEPVDGLARDHRPPPEALPEFPCERRDLHFPARLNCAAELLDRWVERGQVGRLAVKGPTGCKDLDDARRADDVQRGWNFTGDACRVAEDGPFEYQARTDDMIVSGGDDIAGPPIHAAAHRDRQGAALPAARTVTPFQATRQVRFSDCDPAGIVFFPQYLVMLNGFVEQWFDELLRIRYATLIGARRLGLPTVRLEIDFTAVSRHGETLRLGLEVEKLGRSSLALRHEFRAADGSDELRLRARQVLVCTSLDSHRAQAMPDDVRAAIQALEPRP